MIKKGGTMRTGLLTTIAVLTALISSPALSAILYDVNFSEPLNTDGQAITIDSSINTPSSQLSGSTNMSVGYAGLAGNWAIFNQSSCSPYDQVMFDLPPGLTEVYFEADVYPQSLSLSDNSFSIYTDSSNYGARTTSFHGLGNLNVFNYGSADLGSFSNDQLYHLKIHADATFDLFTVEVDGAELYTSTLGSSDITSFRLSMAPWIGVAVDCVSPVAAVSNILVYETPDDLLPAPPVPESTTGEVQAGSFSIPILILFIIFGITMFLSKSRSRFLKIRVQF
jgi:hypothetical protein